MLLLSTFPSVASGRRCHGVFVPVLVLFRVAAPRDGLRSALRRGIVGGGIDSIDIGSSGFGFGLGRSLYSRHLPHIISSSNPLDSYRPQKARRSLCRLLVQQRQPPLHLRGVCVQGSEGRGMAIHTP